MSSLAHAPEAHGHVDNKFNFFVALAMFLADMPLDIIDEVRQEYSDRAFKMIDDKLKAYA